MSRQEFIKKECERIMDDISSIKDIRFNEIINILNDCFTAFVGIEICAIVESFGKETPSTIEQLKKLKTYLDNIGKSNKHNVALFCKNHSDLFEKMKAKDDPEDD